MSKKEKDIELIPFSAATSGWKVKHDTKEGIGTPNQPFPKVSYQEDSGPHLVVFTLPQNSTATFNANSPISVQKGTASPASGIDPQFPDWAIFDGGKTLVVLNRNSEAGEFSYSVKANNYAKTLDPIIDNGGGIQPPAPPEFQPGYSQSQYITTAAIALLVGFVIGFFVHKWFFAK